jgi:glycosyltransferase involved in cell wall biosynthesis
MKKKALYFCAGRSSFVENDLQILSSAFDIKVFVFRPKTSLATIWVYLKQFFFILSNIFSADILVCFFASHHSLLPAFFGRLFGKPSVIVMGGTDCVSFPSIGYGNFSKKGLRMVTKLTYKWATILLPVHKSLIESDYTYQDSDFKKQGFLYFCPDLKTPYQVINFGFDPEKWNIASQKISNSFITVAAGLGNQYRLKLKGIDLILEAAKSFPNAHFTIIGFPDDYKFQDKPNNLTTYPYVSNDELKDLYAKNEFYIQASISEGFPNAICEAMMCGCIPIGSNVGGIPDIIGDTGFVLYKRDSEEFKKLLEQAINCDKSGYSAKARQRIISNYPKDLRKNQLLPLLLKLSNKNL